MYLRLFSLFAILNLLCVACLQRDVSTAPTSSKTTDIPSECTKIGQTWVSPNDGVTLVCISAGKFTMGAAEDDPQAHENEKPQHDMYLDAYWIDSVEVTNVNFGKCLAAGACHPKQYETTADGYVPYSVHPDSQNYPALLYESDPAVEYCQRAGRRLPTEAEWEKAARGTDARLYPWGNIPLDCSLANYYTCDLFTSATSTVPSCGNSEHCKTKQVDSYAIGASPYGVDFIRNKENGHNFSGFGRCSTRML